MGNEFTLLNLAPEPLVLNLNGTKYDVLRPNQFNLRTLALLDRLQAKINEQQAELAELGELDAEDDESQEGYEHLEQQLNMLLTNFIKAVIPTISPSLCKTMTVVEKLQFITWWTSETRPKSTAPETAAGTALVTKPIRKGSTRK